MRRPTGAVTPVVVREDAVAWVVRCQGPECERVIGVPKSAFSAPEARGCIDHPPHTWVRS